jgi:hypothetical protein
MQDVTGANRLQVRQRGVAAITALLFVVCGLLAQRHEASTLHVRTAAGGYVHAAQLDGHHVENNSDIHGQRDPDSDHGDCALLTTYHQAVSAHYSAPALVILAGRGALVAFTAPARRALASSAIYRLAPKTSPPAAV